VWHFIPPRYKGLNKKWLLGNKGPYRIVRKINDVNFVVKRMPKSSEEIVHIDRLTKYKSAVPPRWKKEVEREKAESRRAQIKLDEAVGPPLETNVEREDPMELLEEPCAETQELPRESIGDSEEMFIHES